MSNEWIKNLKVGDKVILTAQFKEPRIAEVEEITPKGFVKVYGMLFNKNGSQRTSSWYTSHITECTEEREEELRQRAVIGNARDLMSRCSFLSYEQAVKIIEILGEEK